MADAERIADGQDHVSHFELVAVGSGDRGKTFPVHFEHGHVSLRVGANQLRCEFLFVVGQDHLDFIRAVHHVVVRQNVAVLGNDHARTEALFLARARTTAVVLRVVVEFPAEETA